MGFAIFMRFSLEFETLSCRFLFLQEQAPIRKADHKQGGCIAITTIKKLNSKHSLYAKD
jgi:hypothetical protein